MGKSLGRRKCQSATREGGHCPLMAQFVAVLRAEQRDSSIRPQNETTYNGKHRTFAVGWMPRLFLAFLAVLPCTFAHYGPIPRHAFALFGLLPSLTHVFLCFFICKIFSPSSYNWTFGLSFSFLSFFLPIIIISFYVRKNSFFICFSIAFINLLI